MASSEPMQWIASPTTTLLRSLSEDQKSKLAYPPDALPGTRDVKTPYGSMRIYEWGSVTGRKVMFVHGDATPAPVFSRIAQGLVERGCRVMLFDLFGRGYSATPLNVQHDSRLFAMQIMMAISSSPLSWTGQNKFSVVAFSLGAPISLEFINAFPWLVEAIVFLGPAGLIRILPPSYENILATSLPLERVDPKIKQIVEQCLGVDTTCPMSKSMSRAEISKDESAAQDSTSVHHSFDFDMTSLLQWQYEFNEGHTYAFYDTVRFGPAAHREHLWEKFGRMLNRGVQSQLLLRTPKILVVFGKDDDVVVGKETSEDIMKFVSAEWLDIRYVSGSHGFVYPNSETILSFITETWHL